MLACLLFQAEFTTLAEWVREKTLFDLISSIGFFKNYLTGRSFRKWHKVRRHFAGIIEGTHNISGIIEGTHHISGIIEGTL